MADQALVPSADPARTSLDRMASIMTDIERFETAKRAFRDLGDEIAAERASPVVDLRFIQEMRRRHKELLGVVAQLHALTTVSVLTSVRSD